MLFSIKIYFCNTACQHGGIPHWGIITVQCIVCSLQERGSFYLRIFKTGSHCFPSFNSLHLFIHSTVFALLSIQWCFLDPSIWVKRWPSVPNIKKVTQCWSELSRRCTSWETGRCRFKLPALETFGISRTHVHTWLVQVDVLESLCVICANHQCVVTHGEWTWNMLNCVE